MNSAPQNASTAKFDAEMTFRLPAQPSINDVNQVRFEIPAIVDAGRVRLGGFGPAFRLPVVADAGRVRVGGFGPAFRLPSIADAGRVRMGGFGPAFRASPLAR